MNKSLHLVAEEYRPVADFIPAFKVSDETVGMLRETMDKMSEPFLIKVEIEPEVVKVNEHTTIYLSKPQNKMPDGEKLPVIYFTHGGGLISGSALSFLGLNQKKADKYNAIYATVEYRLAPENPFPAAIEDVAAGLKWIYDNADEFSIDKNRISTYGESAGGGLTAALSFYVRDKFPEINIKNQILIYPMLDYQTSVDPENFPNKYIGEFVWTHDLNIYGWKSYQGKQAIAQDELAYFSPAHATDFSSLPKTYISFGSLDLFFEEDLKFIQDLSRAGNEISARIVNGAIHGFDSFPNSPIADEYNRELDAYIKDVL